LEQDCSAFHFVAGEIFVYSAPRGSIVDRGSGDWQYPCFGINNVEGSIIGFLAALLWLDWNVLCWGGSHAFQFVGFHIRDGSPLVVAIEARTAQAIDSRGFAD
jgi:hypothetical protein